MSDFASRYLAYKANQKLDALTQGVRDQTAAQQYEAVRDQADIDIDFDTKPVTDGLDNVSSLLKSIKKQDATNTVSLLQGLQSLTMELRSLSQGLQDIENEIHWLRTVGGSRVPYPSRWENLHDRASYASGWGLWWSTWNDAYGADLLTHGPDPSWTAPVLSGIMDARKACKHQLVREVGEELADASLPDL